MTKSWLPDTAANGGPGNAQLAEERARLLARYWDDNESRERNQAIIDWWLQQPRRDDATV